LAGIALIAAEHFDTPRPSRPVSVVSFHAVDDPVLPYEGGEGGGTAPGFPHVSAVEAVASAWAEHSACTSGPNSEELEDGIVVLIWRSCAAPVAHYRLPIGEHRWPGGVSAAGYEDGPDAMSATDVLWDFFSSSGR
jgi:polyhydroxybutyrate depolymerase